MNIDSYKLIQSGGDGGDTCHRMFTVALRMLLNFKLVVDHNIPVPDICRNPVWGQLVSPQEAEILLQASPGIYRRHCDPEFWGSDPRNESRDQLTPVICYLAFLASRSGALGKEYRGKLLTLLKECLKRYMFAQNIYPNWVDARKDPTVKKKTPDFLNFDLWGVFARGFVNTWWFPVAIPFIILGDIFLVLSAMFKVWAPINKDGTLEFRMPGSDDVDDDNMNNVLMGTQHVYQTPLSWLARKIYKKFRRQNLGNTELGEKSAIMGALAYYHRGPQGNPEIAELARPIVERY